MTDLAQQLKLLIVRELNLEDIDPETIDDDAPLFGEGLGLDSLDAVEIVVLIQREYAVEILDMEEGQKALQSINALATFIQERRG